MFRIGKIVIIRSQSYMQCLICIMHSYRLAAINGEDGISKRSFQIASWWRIACLFETVKNKTQKSASRYFYYVNSSRCTVNKISNSFNVKSSGTYLDHWILQGNALTPWHIFMKFGINMSETTLKFFLLILRHQKLFSGCEARIHIILSQMNPDKILPFYFLSESF